MKKTIFNLFIILIIFSFGINVFAMSSTKYKIDTDSINFGGTENSSAGQLLISDTMGEVATGVSSSSKYAISAGYRILQTSYISISAAPDVVMPDMTGYAPGQSNSSESWLVTTDNAAGYELLVKSLTSPSLISAQGASFSDYASVASGTPDYFFSVGPASSTFAFSPEGQDISQKYLDNGSNTCGTGNTDTADRCWDGFSTTNKAIAHRSSSNHPAGTVTSIKYRSAIGTSKLQDAGVYTSTIVVTAVTL